ncbi:hypothetical protein [Reinekea blandensis]|uniref:hypothetical protein n=1 Tax=Reinekea blandensis TaxID=374838 RepID=UPI000324DACD|nr:hypothetical protein [Reinekea blandensis]
MTDHTTSVSARRGALLATGVALLCTILIWWSRPLVMSPDLLPDQGAAWYFWKLPDPTLWSRITAWGGYLLHQFFIWGLIFYAQHQALSYTKHLKPINVLALFGTLGFVVLHWFQTAFWYDGLAQDVSVFSSQGSVILLLVMVLVMENNRRGLFWGKKIPMLNEPGRVFRRYHGYVFAWATIYTFWFHPMENTSGHLIGFFYTFLILIQGALMFTTMHVNKYWKVIMEVMVLFHGTLVAFMLGQEAWPMFMFGFAGMFIITQMHGLNLKDWQKWAFLALYLGGIVAVYSERGFAHLNEVIRIPMIEYLLALLLAGVTWLIMKMVARLQKPTPSSTAVRT